MKVKLFNKTNEELDSIKNKYVLILFLVWVIAIISFVLILIFHDRNQSTLWFLISSIILIVAVIVTITFSINTFAPIKSYLKIVRKIKKHTLQEENLCVAKLDNEIYIRYGYSFKKITFVNNDKNDISFYCPYDETLSLKEGDLLTSVQHCDDILVSFEVNENE